MTDFRRPGVKADRGTFPESVFGRFYIALFSALEHIHGALVVTFIETLLNIKQSGVLTVLFRLSHCSSCLLLHGWCHVKRLSSRRTFYVHHTTMHLDTVPLYASLRKDIMYEQDACVFSINLTPALLAE